MRVLVLVAYPELLENHLGGTLSFMIYSSGPDPSFLVRVLRLFGPRPRIEFTPLTIIIVIVYLLIISLDL